MTRDNQIVIKNIYYMLSYAFNYLNHSTYQNVEKEEFENIHNMFAAILCRGVNLQLKRGLYKEYVELKDDLPVVHGKVDIAGTMKDILNRRQLVSCEFDELSENNCYNRIIKSTMLLLIRCDEVNSNNRAELKKALLFFSTIDQVADLRRIRWNAFVIHRNNQNYRMLLGICQLIIEGMLITTDKGEYKLANFIDSQKMWHLYQGFVLEYYKKHFPELKPHAPQIPWDVEQNSDNELLPVMQTDIVLHYGDKTLIIDAKYYSKGAFQDHWDKKTIVSGNLYQIYTYVKNHDYKHTGNTSGLLLYAKTDEEIAPKGTYKMGNNRIDVDTLDLNVEFGEIKKKLNVIIEKELMYYKILPASG